MIDEEDLMRNVVNIHGVIVTEADFSSNTFAFSSPDTHAKDARYTNKRLATDCFHKVKARNTLVAFITYADCCSWCDHFHIV